MKRSVEVRSYNLKPGLRAEFHDIRVREALPMRRKGPRESVLGKIDSMTSVVLELDDAAVGGLRSG